MTDNEFRNSIARIAADLFVAEYDRAIAQARDSVVSAIDGVIGRQPSAAEQSRTERAVELVMGGETIRGAARIVGLPRGAVRGGLRRRGVTFSHGRTGRPRGSVASEPRPGTKTAAAVELLRAGKATFDVARQLGMAPTWVSAIKGRWVRPT